MKLALTIQTPEVPVQIPVALLSGSLKEKLEKAARMGAAGVEILSTEPASLKVRDLVEQLNSNSLQAAAVASGGMTFAAKLTLLNPDAKKAALARRRLNELIDLAADLHAPVVTVGGFRGRSVEDKKRSLGQLMEILHQAGDYAVERGVVIALEPLNRFEGDLINTVGQGITFLMELGHPAVGLLVNTFHVNIEEASWTEPFRQAMAARKLFHVHLSDNNHMATGRGLIDFGAILEMLYTIGYKGWLSAELLAVPNADTAAQQTMNHMGNLMKDFG